MSMYSTFGPGKFGIAPGARATATPSELHSVPTAAADDPAVGILHPHNPLMAFGVIAAVAFGLMAFSTSVRVGRTAASVQIGKT